MTLEEAKVHTTKFYSAWCSGEAHAATSSVLLATGHYYGIGVTDEDVQHIILNTTQRKFSYIICRPSLFQFQGTRTKSTFSTAILIQFQYSKAKTWKTAD